MPYFLEGPKWGSGETGTGGTVTWSFADLDLEPQLAQIYAGYPDFTSSVRGAFRDAVRSALWQWDAICEITFVEVPDSASSNIRLGERWIDGTAAPGASSVVGRANYWFSDGRLLESAITFDVDAFGSYDRFFRTALHEIGHAIGIDHSDTPTDIMYPSLNVQNQGGLSFSDMAGAHYLYTGGLALQGTSGNDTLTGGSTSDLIFGMQGADVINAGEGNNIVVGGVDSTDGADAITAGSGNDVIYGNGGADTITSSGGNDGISGGYGRDLITTGAGADVIFGNQDNDTIDAGDGANLVFGGRGDDWITAGSGSDTLWGNEGDDTLSGGGADRYVFASGSGADLIYGFSGFGDGDRLDLQGQAYTVGIDASGNVLLTLSGGGTIDLSGVVAGSFQAGWAI